MSMSVPIDEHAGVLATKAWESGDIPRAEELNESVLQTATSDDEALSLQMKIRFVQGQYQAALVSFDKIDKSYKHYQDAVDLAVEACLHQGDIENAWKLARRNKLKEVDYLDHFRHHPFRIEADRTYLIPFLTDTALPSSLFPGVAGRINGKDAQIRFDTGGTFLVLGRQAADKYQIEMAHKHRTMHGPRRVSGWYGIAQEMAFDNGPVFNNVPVVVMDSLGDLVIFGTNILERFLTTVDYPNSRFILTPRSREDLYAEHLKLLPPRRKTLPFYMWDDHYMFAKGSFAGQDDLTLFFDSGLVAVAEINGTLTQAAVMASKERLLQWGINRKHLKQSNVVPTEYSLTVAGLSQPDVPVYYDKNFKKDWTFGGMRIDGLISHAWLKHYTWTVDFDRREYTFGIPDTDR